MVLKELAENLGLEEDEYKELVELFVDTSREDLEVLNSAVAEGNHGVAMERAHSIKGAAGNLGFMEIYETARVVEEKGKEKRFDTVGSDLKVLTQQLDTLTQAL